MGKLERAMSDGRNKPVWIDGLRYGTQKAAADALSELWGREVYVCQLGRILKEGSAVMDGVEISRDPQKPQPTTCARTRGGKPEPLMRDYRPLDMGLRTWH